jgi:hypothetical protein
MHAKNPTGVVELAGHGEEERVWCLVPLPGGNRVATPSNIGKVLAFAVAAGALELELDAREGVIGWRSGRARRRHHCVGRAY